MPLVSASLKYNAHNRASASSSPSYVLYMDQSHIHAIDDLKESSCKPRGRHAAADAQSEAESTDECNG